MAAKKKRSRSGPNIPESRRSSLHVQFRLSLRQRQYLEAKAETAGLTPNAYAQRLVVTSLAVPEDREPADPEYAADLTYDRWRDEG